MSITILIAELSKDPFNPDKNFACAVEYERMNQTASAVSFYLRTAEYGIDTHSILVYNSLLKLAQCFNNQNNRHLTVSNCLLQAIAYNPDRREAYFMLSRFYEQSQQWQESYTMALLGLSATHSSKELPSAVDGYIGSSGLQFQQALAAFHIGRKEEALRIFDSLNRKNLPEPYGIAVKNNLEYINASV